MSGIRYTALALTVVTLLSLSALAQAPTDLAQQAEEHYKSGAYTNAISAYTTLIGQGHQNAASYYNLGNAYYKNQQLGHALLNYERALRITPRDRDIRFNLAFVRSQTQEPPASFFDTLHGSLLTFASLNELTATTGVLLCLLMTLLAVLLFRTDPVLIIGALCTTGLLTFSGGLLALK